MCARKGGIDTQATANNDNIVKSYNPFTGESGTVKVATQKQRLTKEGINAAINSVDAMEIESGKNITINGIEYEAWTGNAARYTERIGKKTYEVVIYQAKTGYAGEQTDKGVIVNYPIIEIPLETKTRKIKGSVSTSYSIAKKRIKISGAVDIQNGFIFKD